LIKNASDKDQNGDRKNYQYPSEDNIAGIISTHNGANCTI